MKTLVIFAALATAIASPALARPAHQNDNSVSVTTGNQYLGADPDANVRFDLQRESGSHGDGVLEPQRSRTAHSLHARRRARTADRAVATRDGS